MRKSNWCINMYSKKLKEMREKRELKQYEMSSILGFKNEEVYGNYERENTTIPIKHLIKVCEYFDCSIDYIFNFTNLKKYKNLKHTVNLDLMREKLRELRKNNKLTQEKLANILKMAPSTLGDYERKAKIIATPFLYDICKKYHISADYLLGKIDKPQKL